jgi:hypothetical protein
MKRWRCVDCKQVHGGPQAPLRCLCKGQTFAELPPPTVEEQIAQTRDLGQLQKWGEAIKRGVGESSREFEATEQHEFTGNA